MSDYPGRKPGLDPSPDRPSIRAALWAIWQARRGKPETGDGPGHGKFPMTPGARTARAHDRRGDHPRLF